MTKVTVPTNIYFRGKDLNIKTEGDDSTVEPSPVKQSDAELTSSNDLGTLRPQTRSQSKRKVPFKSSNASKHRKSSRSVYRKKGNLAVFSNTFLIEFKCNIVGLSAYEKINRTSNKIYSPVAVCSKNLVQIWARRRVGALERGV